MDKLEYIPGDLANQRDDRGHWSIRPLSALNLATLINYNDIKPIPLTTEILEKNGWKKDGKWYKLSTKRAYLYITKDIKIFGEFLVCVSIDKHNLASVSFVHELQHLLFGLGLNSEMEV